MRKLAKPQAQLFNRLGQFTGDLLNEIKNEHEGYDDVEAWGAPSECNTLVAKNAKTARFALIEQWVQKTGWSAPELAAQLYARVSYGWLYKTGIGVAIDEYIGHLEMREVQRNMLRWQNTSKLKPNLDNYLEW